MLSLLESKSEVREAQKLLKRALERDLPSRGVHTIGFPGGSSAHEVRSLGDGSLYYAYAPPGDNAIPRHWNSFGVFQAAAGTQSIIAEINVPVSGDDARVSGAFAKDSVTGDIYLMHDGGLGGGRKGVGREPFLATLSDPVIEVRTASRSRAALRIANLADPGLAALIWRFVQKAQAFKLGQVHGIPPASADGGLKPYKPEFSGRKKGLRPGEFDYHTYHGLVVDALYAECSRVVGAHKVGRSQLVDLFVTDSGRRTEVYEVKTSGDRTSLYGGIGQLVTHAADPATKRTLVLPAGTDLPSDCAQALARMSIGVRHFRIRGKGMRARVELLAA